MRKRGTVVLIVVTLLLAGCGGVSGPNGETQSPPAAESGADTAAGTTPAGGTSAKGMEQWRMFDFSEGEYYRFSLRDEINDEESELVWEVLAVEDGAATVNLTYSNGTHSFSTTATGDRTTIQQQLLTSGETTTEKKLASEAGQHLIAGPLNAMTNYLEFRELKVGNSWEVSGSEESGYLMADVEQTSQYAGQECYLTVFTVPEDSSSRMSRFEMCVDPDVGLSLYTAYYGDDPDQPNLVVTLEEYRQ